MDKTIRMGNREVPMRATAATVRHYRVLLGRDLLTDLLSRGEGDAAFAMETLENLAFIMARQRDPSLPDTVEDWLDTFDDPMAVFSAADDILALWNANTAALEESKKK